MKLTVIKADEQMDTVISNISKIAQTVKTRLPCLISGANDDFHIKFTMSRRVFIPVEKESLSDGFMNVQEDSTVLKLTDSLLFASKRI